MNILAYRCNEGKPFVFPVVRKTDIVLANNESLTKEYFIIEEDTNFKRLTLECVLGKNSPVINEKRVSTVRYKFTQLLITNLTT